MKSWVVAGLVMCFFILVLPCFAQDITGSLDVFYRRSTTESDGKKSTSWQLFQNYFLNYATHLTTNTTCNLGIRVNYINNNGKEQNMLYPTINLNTINEYFSANASYNRLEQYGEEETQRHTTSFWNFNIMSQMEEWPKIMFQYNRSHDYDHLEVHQINNKSENFMGGINYTYKFLDIMYNYMRNISNNLISRAKQVGNNHISRLGLHQSFFGGRLSISSEGGFTYYDTITTTPTGGFVEGKISAGEGFYGVDSTPLSSQLTSNLALIDGNNNVVVLTNISDNTNIGMGFSQAESINAIYVYASPSYTYPATPAPDERVVWDVYYSNDEGTIKNWTLLASDASFTFNSAYHRFEISFSETNAKYFKVVYHPESASPSLSVTEIEAYGRQYKTKTSTKGYTGSFSLSAHPWEKWNTSYHLSYYRTETSPQGVLNYTFSHGASVGWQCSRYFFPTLSYQTSKNVTSEDEIKADTYSLNIQSSPIETLTTSLVLSHTETDSKKGIDSITDSAALSTVTTIWQGVDINWNLNVSRARSSIGNRSLTVTSDIYLRAILTRYLSWDIDYSQNWSKTSNEETTTSSTTNINTTLVYTPSSRLYGRVFLQYNKTGSEKTFSHEYAIGVFLTRKIQLNWVSRFTEAETKDEMAHSANLNWNVTRHSNFNAGWSYSKFTNGSEQKSSSFYVRYPLSC